MHGNRKYKYFLGNISVHTENINKQQNQQCKEKNGLLYAGTYIVGIIGIGGKIRPVQGNTCKYQGYAGKHNAYGKDRFFRGSFKTAGKRKETEKGAGHNLYQKSADLPYKRHIHKRLPS